MWARWARRHRLIGLTFLSITAVAIAVAVLLFTTNHPYWAGAFAGVGVGFIAHAGVAFFMAHRYTQIGA